MTKKISFDPGLCNRIRVELSAVILFTLLVTLPFINKAFHIDDWCTLTGINLLTETESLYETYTTEGGYLGEKVAGYKSTRPPMLILISYWFSLLTNSLNEKYMHIFFIIFPLIVSVSSYFISRQFTKIPLLTTLLMISTPGFLVMSHSIMSDIPMLAFFLTSLAFHIYGVKKENTSLCILAGVISILAWLTTYQAIFLFFLLPMYNLTFQYKKLKYYIPITLSFITFILWSLFTWLVFDIPHPFAAILWFGDSGTRAFANFIPKLFANINALGAATIFPFFILAAFWIKYRTTKLLLLSLLLAASISIPVTTGYKIIHKFLFIIFFSTGFLFITDSFFILKKAWEHKNKNLIFLSLWFLTFFILCIFLMPLGISRYLLPCFLPFILLILTGIETIHQKTFIHWTIAGIILTFIAGISIAAADYEYAGVYRKFSKKIKSAYNGKTIWFTGEWGFRWYMEKDNYNYLLIGDTRPAKGDIIITPSIPCPIPLNNYPYKLKLIDKIYYKGFLPVRTVNSGAHAGFYSDRKGQLLLPYSISIKKLEEFKIYRVLE